jgi:superoxide dismutase, Cu-Zn family
MKKSFAYLVVLLLAIPLVNIIAQSSTKVERAICTLNPTQGSKVSGTVTFAKVDEGVRIVADVQGLSKGKHGIHIHEFGDCSSPDGNSAGGHFNPHSKNHGAPDIDNRHAGDMGNIEVDETGKGHLEYVDKTISLEGDGSIVGKSIIVHANEDDLKTQPTGNAGGRLACGLIEVL